MEAPSLAASSGAAVRFRDAQDRALEAFIAKHQKLFVLTGAGCSTRSGIPGYRDAEGNWKGAQPVTFQAFMRDAATRQRYWARSLVGWPRFTAASPNPAHLALARLEQLGKVTIVLTQNVDRLHQAAGSARVIDLHGRLDRIRCMTCSRTLARTGFQHDLERRNPAWAALDGAAAPDGDARIEDADFASFGVPACPGCGGTLKPDVVFFGENVPRERVGRAMAALAQSDAMLIVGSSLMVYSGFRFVQSAAQAGLPIAIVNLGRTRADMLDVLKVEQPCERALAFLLPGESA